MKTYAQMESKVSPQLFYDSTDILLFTCTLSRSVGKREQSKNKREEIASFTLVKPALQNFQQRSIDDQNWCANGIQDFSPIVPRCLRPAVTRIRYKKKKIGLIRCTVIRGGRGGRSGCTMRAKKRRGVLGVASRRRSRCE